MIQKKCLVQTLGNTVPCGLKRTKKLQTGNTQYKKFRLGVAQQPIFASREFVNLLKQNSGLLRYVGDIMTKKMSVIETGKRIYDKKAKVGIQLICCKRNRGNRNEGIYRVAARGFTFFVKRNLGTMDTRRAMEETKGLEAILKEHKHKIGTLNLGMIRPHLVTNQLFVSDFYGLGEVQLVADVTGQKRIELDNAIKDLSEEAYWRNNIGELSAENTFYDKKQNKLLLFDWTPTNTDKYDYQ